MNWEKLGFVFKPAEHNLTWHKSHAMTPTPIVLEDKIRVYYTGRSMKGESQISYIDLDKNDPLKIKYIHPEPLFDVGPIGTFDDSGTICTSVINTGDRIYLYYTAYSLSVKVPYRNSIGVAVSHDGGDTFNRMYEGPILDRSRYEPYFVISPCVLKIGDLFHMWYASATQWILVNGKPESVYHIKYATSQDGLNWSRQNESSILPLHPEEANARPTVIQDGETLKMYFTYRGSRDFRDGADSYRIGYAEANIQSPNKWVRMDDKAGIQPGPEHYDNLMQAYPAQIKLETKSLLFYNGNGFGVDGILLAQK